MISANTTGCCRLFTESRPVYLARARNETPQNFIARDRGGVEICTARGRRGRRRKEELRVRVTIPRIHAQSPRSFV
ncbi:hypothetical protein NL676_000739 [Syzygium grande]|nr:hypothetical protein NL676_000739 [Syzygium grande]